MPTTTALIRDIGAREFESEVLVPSQHLLVLVDFWAPWCGPCRMLSPVLERVVEDYSDRVRLAKVNTDEEPELAARFHIQGIPNVKAFREGREVDGFVGVVPESEIRRLIERHALDPDRDELDAARALADKGHLSEAIARLEPLVARRERSLAALHLAELYLRQGRTQEARQISERFRPGDVPDEPLAKLNARLYFATVLERLDEVPSAVGAAARAIFAGFIPRALETLLEALPASRSEERDHLREAFLAALTLLDDETTRLEYRKKFARLLH